jgi:hypothetical protein
VKPGGDLEEAGRATAAPVSRRTRQIGNDSGPALVPCRLSSATRVRALFIIERGRPRLRDLDRMTALDPSLVPGNGKPGSCTGGEEPAVDAWLRWSDRVAYGRLA